MCALAVRGIARARAQTAPRATPESYKFECLQQPSWLTNVHMSASRPLGAMPAMQVQFQITLGIQQIPNVLL